MCLLFLNDKSNIEHQDVFYWGFTFSNVKDCEIIHQTLQTKDLHGNAKKNFLVKKSSYFFFEFITSEISFTNRNLLVMDG
jgi:hypothetical protein